MGVDLVGGNHAYTEVAKKFLKKRERKDVICMHVTGSDVSKKMGLGYIK